MLCLVYFAPGRLEAKDMSLQETSSMRCSKGIVSINDTFYEVEQKCGLPTTSSPGQWIYDFGRNEFIYIIKFRDSRVHKIINTGNYGY